MNSLIKTLKSIELFSNISDKYLVEVENLFNYFELKKGEVLYHQNENRTKIWILTSGVLSVLQDGIVLNSVTEIPGT